MNESLSGKSAIVTGASKGIGAAIARALASQGVRVALVARNQSKLQAVADEIGNNAVPFSCDLKDREAVNALAQSFTAQFGGAPDIIVNNAGLFDLQPVNEMSTEFFLDTIDINLTAPFLLIRAFLPSMRTRGDGHIVNIGSISDRVVMPENGAYSAAKFGLRALNEILRMESNGSGVRVTLISPGAVNTELWDQLLTPESTRLLPSREMMLNPNALADAVVYAVTQPKSVNIDELRLSRS